MKRHLFLLFAFLFCHLTLTFSQNSDINKAPISDSLLLQLKNGNDDYTIITELYRYNPKLTEDSINALFNISNENYFKNNEVKNKDLELQFRSISLSDQIYRIKCYFHKTIEYSVVQRNDSLLQLQFLSITNNHKELSLLDGSFYQRTFYLLLIHSVTTLQTHFFEENFHMYSAGFFNNFKTFPDLQLLLDSYLKFKFNKQYFNTEFGKGVLPDNSFGLLPGLTETELKQVFSELQINGAKY